MNLQLTISDLEAIKAEIKLIVKEVLEEYKKNPESHITGLSEVAQKEAVKRLALQEESKEYLTRKEVSQKLKVSLVTLNNWQKAVILLPYKANKRVLYRISDVENILQKTEPSNY